MKRIIKKGFKTKKQNPITKNEKISTVFLVKMFYLKIF